MIKPPLVPITRFGAVPAMVTSFLVLFVVSLVAYPQAAQAGEGAGLIFVDDDGSVHEADIEALAVAGLTLGCNPPDNDRFCPDSPLTRGQAAAFFDRGFSPPEASTNHFVDDEGSAFEAAINRLAGAGLTKGCNPPANDRFCPTDVITRAEWASLLTRALDLSDGASADAFTDDTGSVHEADINRLAAAGLAKGCNPPANDRYCPTAHVTRAQAATFLVRALSLPTAPGWGDDFPTPETTGARVPYPAMTRSGSIKTTHDGQVIDRVDITGNIIVLHDNVTVRDSRVSFTSGYGLHVKKGADGSCPEGTLFEYVEVDGRLAAEDEIPLYSPGCEWTLDHAYIHDVGRSSRMVRNNTITNSYIYSSRQGDSGAHRGGVGLNGGQNNKLINNVLLCEGTGCSAALAMYGDTQPIDNILIRHNLMAATAAYCAYGGSVSSKPYPEASNVRFIDNHFSTRFFPDCGRAGPITSFDNNVRGNVWEGNVWHETGKLVDP